MPRKLVIKSNFYPYHISARSNNRDWFSIPLSIVYNIYAEALQKTKSNSEIKIHSFVLMSNHIHMLITTPNSNISEAMRYFMTESSRAIARQSQRINRIYGKRYHWTLIKNSEQYAHCYKYIYRNPVKAQICNLVQEYKWSTISPWHKKFSELLSPHDNGFDEYIPQDKQSLLIWLNDFVSDQYINHVEKAIKKHEFKFTADKKNGKIPNYRNSLHPKNMSGT